MLDRTAQQFDVTPSRLVADGGYGLAEMVGWLVDERGIEPHVRVFDKSERTNGTFSRSDFAFDPEGALYVCPGSKELRKYHRLFSKPRGSLLAEVPLPAHRRLWRVFGFDRGESRVRPPEPKAIGTIPGQGSQRDRMDFSQKQSNSRRPQGVCDVTGVRRQQGGHRVEGRWNGP